MFELFVGTMVLVLRAEFVSPVVGDTPPILDTLCGCKTSPNASKTKSTGKVERERVGGQTEKNQLIKKEVLLIN